MQKYLINLKPACHNFVVEISKRGSGYDSMISCQENNDSSDITENVYDLVEGNMKKLEVHNCTFYNKEYLSSAIPILQNVKVLTVTHVNISDSVSNMLQTLPQLEILSLTYCDITTLPAEIFKDVRNLIKIDLSRNSIEILPNDVFKNLYDLQVLDMNGNLLKEIHPALFRDLFSLYYINFSNNNLSNMRDISFHSSVHHIDFSINNLSSGINMFSTDSVFEEVRTLNLSHNRLSKFENGWKYNWLGLENLDLSNNLFKGDLNTRELHFLKHNQENFTIDISNNLVERIIFKQERKSYKETNLRLILTGNPIKCDCFATELKELLQTDNKNKYKGGLSVQMTDFPCKKLNYSMLNCEYPGPGLEGSECSANCSCSLNRYYNEVSVNCSHKNLNRLPEIISLFLAGQQGLDIC